MSRFSWRSIVGPVITLAVAGLILLGEQYLFRVPNPGALTFIAVAFAAYIGGIASGLISAAISIGFAAIHFSPPGELFQLSTDNLHRLLVVSVCTPAIAIMTGILQARAERALERERVLNKELRPLRAALDQSDEVGIVLLDAELRAQFINRAFRRLWELPDEVADRKPAFVGLLYHARDTKAYAVPADKVNSYISDRAARVKVGDERPVDIRLANGKVIRARCKALADGGRMLTYGNVSDLVHSADEMADLAMKDALTGIFNRRHFTGRLESEWKRFERYGRPLSLLILDIDHFKSINDRYGHDTGDQVIISVGGMCQAQTRDSDVAARIGGEEFAILLPETNVEEARAVAERLRQAVAGQTLTHDGQDIAVTISIGAAFADATIADPAEFMKRVDAALYAAKRGGRNRVVVAPDSRDSAAA